MSVINNNRIRSPMSILQKHRGEEDGENLREDARFRQWVKISARAHMISITWKNPLEKLTENITKTACTCKIENLGTEKVTMSLETKSLLQKHKNQPL